MCLSVLLLTPDVLGWPSCASVSLPGLKGGSVLPCITSMRKLPSSVPCWGPHVGVALEVHTGAFGLREPCMHSHPIPSRRPVCLCKCHCSQLWSTGLPAQQALGLGTKKTVPPFCKELFRVVRFLCCLVGWVFFWGGGVMMGFFCLAVFFRGA